MSYDRELLRKNMLEINRLLDETCRGLPASVIPSLEVIEDDGAYLGTCKNNIRIRARLTITKTPETF